MEVCKYDNDKTRGHYMRHVEGASRLLRRNNTTGVYSCPKCDKQFKSKEYRPHCPICDYGLTRRVKRGWAQ